MTDEKPRPRYWLVGTKWAEGWFLLALLAGLFFGAAGLASAVASYFGLRAVLSRRPAPFAAACALVIAVLTFVIVKLVLGHG